MADVDGEIEIKDISCSSMALCVAVDEKGNILTSTDPTAGASSWTITHLSEQPFMSVSCVATEFCLVAGDTSFASSNPTGGPGNWTPIGEEINATGGVACGAPTLCVAAAGDANSGIEDSSDPAGGKGSWYHGDVGNVGARILDGVSCPSGSLCAIADGQGNVLVAAPTHRLSVSILGSGTGGVESTLIACPFRSCSHAVPHILEAQPITLIECADALSVLTPQNDCALGFPTTNEVTLKATPGTGSMFDGWSGACSGITTCTVSMSSDQTVDATFVPEIARSTGGPAPPLRLAQISSLLESNAVFAVASRSTPLRGTTARRHPHGTVFSFDLDQAATVDVAITASRPGRRSGHNCQPDNHALRHRPRCTRHIMVMTLIRTAHAGPNTINFTGRVENKTLNHGDYKAEITATNQAGTTPPHILNFTIVPN